MNRRNMNLNLGNCTPTTCPKAGIKIHQSDNDPQPSIHNINRSKLTKPVNFHTTTMDTLELNLDHYSLEDLYALFYIHDGVLNETSLKSAKQIVLKIHPDKSRLDAKYFLFFSKAYKRLYGIYEFQNKSTNKTYKDEEFYDESNKNVLNQLFKNNKQFKEPENFNKWFNTSFEKHRLEDPLEQGYGDWLKSDDGIMNISENVTKGNMNEIFEQKKKQIQSVQVYNGVTDIYASTLGGSLLSGSDNFSTEQYTDIRQAYTETLIPVTNEDYERMPKFKNVNEYQRQRESIDTTPLSDPERILYEKEKQLNSQSSALAFKYAQESENARKKQQSFWGDIKQITGGF